MPNTNLNEQRYRVLIDNAPEVVLIFDVELGRFIDANQSAIDLLQFSREELFQLGPSDISPRLYQGRSAAEKASAFIQQALAGGNPAFEWVHIDREGRKIPCEVRLIRFPPYDRPVVRASIIDLTDKKSIEARLTESEERLKLAIRATGLGCYDWHPQENKIHWDAGMHKLFGLEPSNPIDRNEHFTQCIHPDDLERVTANFQIYLDAESDLLTFEDEYRIIRDKKVVHLLSVGEIVRAENGEVQRIIGTVQDITERIRTNKQIQHQATLLNKVSDAVIETDASYAIRSWNKGAEKMYGWTAEEAIGQFLGTLVLVTYLKESREEVRNRFLNDGYWNGEVIQQNRAGEELYVLSSVTVLKNAQGEMTGSIGVNRDISYRRQAELALRESEARYRSLVERFPNGTIALFDQDLRYTLMNGEGINQLGMDQTEIIGKGLGDLYSEEVRKRDEPYQVAALQGEKSTRIVPINASYYSITTLPVRDEQGEIVAGLEVSQDITTLVETEKKLNKTLEQLQLAIQTAELGIWQHVIATDQLEVNDRLLEMYGADPSTEGISRESWREQVHPDDKAQVQQDLAKLSQGNHLAKSVFRAILPDGKIRHIQAAASPIYDQDGRLVELIGINIDITSIKKKEEALRDREERFRTVFNQQFQFMAILSPEGRFLEVNDLSLRVVGVAHAEVLGSFFWKAPAWAKLPRWQVIIKDLIFQAAQSQETLLAELAFLTTVGEERWADTSFTAILNADGELKYILVQASDITERKLAQENLLQAQQELSELANRFQISTRAARIGIWDWNIKKDQLIWDETMLEIYGIPRKQFTDRMQDWQQYLHPEDLDLFQEVIRWSSIGQQELLNTEFRIQRGDGPIRHIKAVGSVQRDDQGQVVRIIGTNWDITQEKEAEQERIRARQLELRNRELEQFAYVASHDLQEPLRTVISFVGLLKRGYQDRLDERANEYLQFVVDASSRMSQLIKGLLEYSRIGTNRELTLVDSAALVQQILNDLSAQISSTQTVIEVDPLPQIKGYETELRMLFQNLISNAIKFRKTDQHPHIHIGVKDDKKNWTYSVQDDGIGIDPMYREQIFALFQRLHGRQEYEGTGIGLAHCQKIVDLHGGTIWVESELHKGSTFFFSIAKSEKELD